MHFSHHAHHLHAKLRVFYLSGLITSVISYFCIKVIAESIGYPSAEPLIILSIFGMLFLLGYVTLWKLHHSTLSISLAILVALNIFTSMLVAVTGVFQSPFLLLSVVWISLTAKLHARKLALVHFGLSFIGMMVAFLAVENGVAYPFKVPFAQSQENISVFISYLFLYSSLILFAAFSLFPRIFRLRQESSIPHDIHEAIVQNAPMGIIALDHLGHILGGNDMAKKIIAWEHAHLFHERVGKNLKEFKDLLHYLSSNQKMESLVWRIGQNSETPITISVSARHGKNDEDTDFIVFLH